MAWKSQPCGGRTIAPDDLRKAAIYYNNCRILTHVYRRRRMKKQKKDIALRPQKSPSIVRVSSPGTLNVN
ncbi:hypothetical protein ACRE_046000 [Hapsidospora chrysogenum ATCC 11550]|uniref:Uncharacterized protein n=1 Tax=Hapsidospora chrysogenum (strain ATCC 11550 / CBS 779.69 / DSM 880 / IAM 14645 / JCM 23072 / IMI 49137) TaxID=857340 RepID=A0A086T5K2_HAPC1|nr:hypothetical protein ACRE_046000 [Hapsidospora chrysogenum ATCC 11550]